MSPDHLKKLLAEVPCIAHGHDGLTVITGPVRLAFVHFAKPYAPKNSKKEPRYSCTAIVPAGADWAALKAAAVKAWQASPAGASGQPPHKDAIPFKLQAEAKSQMTGKHYEGFAQTGDAIFFRCETKEPVPVFGVDAMPMAPDAAYSGMWARLKVRAQAYPSIDGGKPGVKLWLQSVQKISDDEQFKSSNPSDGFSALQAPPGDAPASVPKSANGAGNGVW